MSETGILDPGPLLSGRSQRALLVLLLLASAALRLWFATSELDYRRFYDERYSLANVGRVMDGEFRPEFGWYPSLSYLPQAALLSVAERLHQTTGIEWLKVRKGRQKEIFTPTGFLICRILQCCYGVLSLALLFAIGARTLGRSWGLLAAFLLSLVPEHIRLSTYIKPDMLMLVLILVTFLIALRAYRHPGWRIFALGGLSVGLTAAAKPYGIPGALPLVVAAMSQATGRRLAIARLATAGLVSVAVFTALNPFWATLLDYGYRNVSIYAERGEGRLSVLGNLLVAPATRTFHGPVVGLAALVGLLLMLGMIWRRRGTEERRAQAAMVVLYLVGYVALCTVLFSWAKSNLVLPMIPFTALAAAWFLERVTRRQSWGRLRAGRRLLIGGCALILAWQLFFSLQWAYKVRVPTTHGAAAALLASKLPAPLEARLVVVEEAPGGARVPRAERGRETAALRRIERLPDLGKRQIGLADAQVFPNDRLSSSDASQFYRDLRDRVRDPRRRFVIAPRLLRLRGPALQVLLRPWRRVLTDRAVTLRRTASDPPRFSGEISPPPGLESTLHSSVSILIDQRNLSTTGYRLSVAGGEIELHWIKWAGEGRHRLLSARFRVTDRRPRLTLELRADVPGDEYPLTVHYWARGKARTSER